ncbi:MAG: class I SAM-dependent methyltransferase, partial [Planctomycetia bacterium]
MREQTMGYERFSPVARRIDVCGTPYTIWQPADIDALIDVEAFERDERIPYWAQVWESAIVLAEELAAGDGAGLTLLELGCGIGLPAIVAARRGFRTTASDYETHALESVRFNADRNGAAGLAVRLLDWRALPADLGTFDR